MRPLNFVPFALLAVLAACGQIAEQSLPSKAKYNCEGYVVDVDNVKKTASLRKASGNKMMKLVSSDNEIKYMGEGSSSFIVTGEEAKLKLGKKSYSCK